MAAVLPRARPPPCAMPGQARSRAILLSLIVCRVGAMSAGRADHNALVEPALQQIASPRNDTQLLLLDAERRSSCAEAVLTCAMGTGTGHVNARGGIFKNKRVKVIDRHCHVFFTRDEHGEYIMCRNPEGARKSLSMLEWSCQDTNIGWFGGKDIKRGTKTCPGGSSKPKDSRRKLYILA